MNKILTISVAAYNAEAWLNRCLDSFLIPDILDDLEVIIVNDGSKDKTAEAAADYAERYPDTFHVINKENGGHGSTVNAAIKIASGKYFRIVDADDWVEHDGLINLIKVLKQQTVDAVLSPFYRVNLQSGNKEKVSYFDGNSNLKNCVMDVKQLDSIRGLSMHAITFKTDILQNHYNPLDEHCFYVDAEYLVYYLRYVQSIFVTDFPFYDYLLGSEEQSINMRNMVKRRDQHQLVCSRLLDLYSDPLCKKRVVQDIIEGCVRTNYLVLMNIPDKKQSKIEFCKFDKDLKTKFPDAYRNAILNGMRVGNKTAVGIICLRALRYHGYGLFYRIVNGKNSQ